MAKINENFNKLAGDYLFMEVIRRTKEFLAKNPNVKIYKLGIGDTTEPLTPTVIKALHDAVDKLSKVETYTGYGEIVGDIRLRQALANRYAKWKVDISAEEIFINDGAKPDLANIQSIFDKNSIIAVQDPVYPVYVDSNVIAGRTGRFNNGRYDGIIYMPCTEENGFIPKVPHEKVDLIYLCSPNNPTGAVATKEQLKSFVDYAIENKAVIIFDAAYTAYIRDENLPKSIYEIKDAKKCAIEISSFSKEAGFTGVRLGWTVVPKELVVEGTKEGKVWELWKRRQSTHYNGTSIISQEGGLAVLSEEGQKECKALIDYYMGNAKIIKDGLKELGIVAYGGENAPYIWLKTPNNMSSWSFFDKLLNEAHVVGTPGVGFGPSGEGFFRLTAYGHRENIEQAVESIRKNLKL
ncbi:MAG: LL-diaminopimelate aminotransferase [Candidatus Bathyarchaeia archaeon]